MADTDALRQYRRANPPTIDGGDRIYVDRELQKLEVSVSLIISTMVKLEARIVALGG